MNQELLINLSPYLLLSPYPPCIGFPSLRPCIFASLRSISWSCLLAGIAQAERLAGIVLGDAVETVVGVLLEEPDAEAAERDTEDESDPERHGDEEKRVEDEPGERPLGVGFGVLHREVADGVVSRLESEEKRESEGHTRQ